MSRLKRQKFEIQQGFDLEKDKHNPTLIALCDDNMTKEELERELAAHQEL
jgi:hypothetical protein